MGDTSTFGDQLTRGLFGALSVQPAKAEWYRSQVTADALARATYNAKSLPANASISAGACTAAVPCTLKFTGQPAVAVKQTQGGYLNTLDNYPLINYDATYSNGTPILKMLDNNLNIVYSDLTAMITGPKAGRFPGANGVNKPDPPCDAAGAHVDPLFCKNPASLDRRQPYREITTIYHGALGGVTGWTIAGCRYAGLSNSCHRLNGMSSTTIAGQDAFAINYGTGGIGAEIYANRIGVGPMGNCADCKFEEFFLSAWSVGDPAMVVDRPANVSILDQKPPLPSTPAAPALPPPPPLCTAAQLGDTGQPPDPNCANARVPAPPATPYSLAELAKATMVYYPEDPSNIYHSYLNDHVKFRILHGGNGVTHVHHQHAPQWCNRPTVISRLIWTARSSVPEPATRLEMVYNGSGNRNKIAGDSLFHCHFYPHFAAGMWARNPWLVPIPTSHSTETAHRLHCGTGLPLGPQSGAPFADPAVDDDGNAVGKKRVYKAAAIEMDVGFR